MSKTLRETVADNVKMIRITRGLTQLELAKRAKISTVYISKIEKCNLNLTLDTIEQIATALEVQVSNLLEGVKHPNVRITASNEKAIRQTIKILEAVIQPKRR